MSQLTEFLGYYPDEIRSKYESLFKVTEKYLASLERVAQVIDNVGPKDDKFYDYSRLQCYLQSARLNDKGEPNFLLKYSYMTHSDRLLEAEFQQSVQGIPDGLVKTKKEAYKKFVREKYNVMAQGQELFVDFMHKCVERVVDLRHELVFQTKLNQYLYYLMTLMQL